ncbi:MAG: PEGA domain-containing protein [Myxococcota bacterium]
MREVHRTLSLLGRGIGAFLILTASPASAQDRVLIVPTLTLSPDAEAAATQFQSELISAVETRESLSAVLGDPLDSTASPKSGRPRALPRTRRELADGKKLAEKLRIPQAIKQLERGLALFADAPDSVDDFDVVIEATLLLAEAYFRRGKDDLGRKRLADVARLRSTTELSSDRYPPLFINVWQEVRDQELARTRGTLAVEGPAGASVTINGRRLGTAPLRITELVPGVHHVIIGSAGSAQAKSIAVAEGREAKLSGEVSRSLDMFTTELQRAVRADGRSVRARLAVVSAVASSGNGYQIETLVGSIDSGEFQRLDSIELSRSLIGTTLEAKAIARQLEGLRAGLDRPISGQVPFIGNQAVISGVSAGPMTSVPYQEPRVVRVAVDAVRSNVSDVDAVQAPDPLDPSAQPYVDLEVRDGDSILDAWWFWPAVGAVVVGAATVTYFGVLRDDSVDGVSLEAVW